MPCGEHLAGLSQVSDSLPVQPYWGYEDIAIFFALAALMNTAVRLGARFHVITQSEITNPGIRLQFIIVLILSLGLYLTLKLRYRRPIVRALGWTAPSMRYTIIALAAGIFSAAGGRALSSRPSSNTPAGRQQDSPGLCPCPHIRGVSFPGFSAPRSSANGG